MTDNEKTLALIAAFLALWFWQKGHGDVTLKQTCTFPDGTTVDVGLGEDCPFDFLHGGQSQIEGA